MVPEIQDQVVALMTSETANKVTAVAAVSSPWWLPPLQDVSQIAAMLLPIGGLILVGVQIYVKIKYRK